MPGFDAKSLLEAVVAGNSQAPAPSQDQLRQLLDQAMQPSSGAGGGLGGMLGQVLGGQGGGLGGILGQVVNAVQGGQTNVAPAPAGGPAGGLGDILNQVLSGAGSGQGGLAAAAGAARNIFANATQGVQDANGQSAATPALDEVIRQITGGQGGGDLVAKARAIIAQNPGMAGALAGALGTVLIGSGTGRTIAADAAKLGGLVLIGGLAYKAYENYKNGQPASAIATSTAAPAPAGTGFEPQAQSNDSAQLYVRAMVAAASAGGALSAGERAKITGLLQQAGHSADAAQFLDRELAKPASVAELATGAATPEVAAQVYTAGRMAIEPGSAPEKAFLAQLATALKLPAALVQSIDAAASANKV